MGGSLGGHGAAWPLPTVTHAALHAALWRADLEEVLDYDPHEHRHWNQGASGDVRNRKFGSVVTAGPFPVLDGGQTWLFPRPLDAGLDAGGRDSTGAVFLPLKAGFERGESSLAEPLRYPVAAVHRAGKSVPASWWTAAAWQAYLNGASHGEESGDGRFFVQESVFADQESSYGIGMDPGRGTQDGERFYSAQYLRLRPGARIGLLAEAWDKGGHPQDVGELKTDLIRSLFPGDGGASTVLVGGQQRTCTVEAHHGAPVPLPRGKSAGFAECGGKWLVKWVLLSPAIYPAVESGQSPRGTERNRHGGGWLPNWICPESGRVLLQEVSREERRRRRSLNYAGKGYRSEPDVRAALVAALVGKPIPVTGYALPSVAAGVGGGAKPTHFAVPPGSVYYFEAERREDAEKLARLLNWHGRGEGEGVANRRSTLFGEKGFGLGVCGTWGFHVGK
jgi:CRISPR-associated protein Cmr3